MTKTANRKLVLAPGFGGGRYELKSFASDEQDQQDLIGIFGEIGIGILSPRISPDDAALARAAALNAAIEQAAADSRVTIATYSGGGLVVRCAMSVLRREKPQVYDRIDLISVRDGAVNGALVPAAFLYLAKLLTVDTAYDQELGRKPVDIDIDVDVPEALMLPMAQELLYAWSNDYSDDWRNEKNLSKHLNLRPHPSRTELQNTLQELDDGAPWGQGIHKAAYSNGSVSRYFTDNDLLSFVANKSGSFGKTISLSFRSTGTRGEFLAMDFDGAAKFKGTKIESIELTNIGSHVLGNFESYPGSHSGTSNTLPSIKKMSEDIAKKYSMNTKTSTAKSVISYIPTTSSLDIGKPPDWIITASDQEIRSASPFDEVFWSKTNTTHGNPQWTRQIIDRVKEGPPA